MTTQRGVRRIISGDNMAQASTIAGTLSGVIGVSLVSTPSLWLQILGQVLIAVGGIAVGHDELAQ